MKEGTPPVITSENEFADPTQIAEPRAAKKVQPAKASLVVLELATVTIKGVVGMATTWAVIAARTNRVCGEAVMGMGRIFFSDFLR